MRSRGDPLVIEGLGSPCWIGRSIGEKPPSPTVGGRIGVYAFRRIPAPGRSDPIATARVALADARAAAGKAESVEHRSTRFAVLEADAEPARVPVLRRGRHAWDGVANYSIR